MKIATTPGRRTRSRALNLTLVLAGTGTLVVGCGGGGDTTSTSPTTTAVVQPTAHSCAATSDAYAQAVLADGPIAYYRFDEATGTTLCDASASHNQGTYATRGIVYSQPGALHNPADSAIAVTGAVRPAVSDANITLAQSGDFTLEGWFRTTTRQDQMVVDIGQAGPQGLAGVGPWVNQVSSSFVVTPGSRDYVSFDTYDGSFTFDASGVGIDVFDGHWH